MSRQYDVTESEVTAAWEAVRQAGGGSGLDNVKISDIAADLGNQLYKIWNRMTSGSYVPPPVLLVSIPKANGGVRQLGIPTVGDRIAQMVVKNRLEPILDPKFHEDSFAYRPGRSAIDAVTLCRERCFRKEWVLEIDIKGFFDNLDHDMLMEMVQKHTDDKVVLLYVKKWLKASARTEDGVETVREMGIPQGGVVSPILANLYLHEVFDMWMKELFSSVTFERYADDIVVHCVSEEQAYYLKNRIEARMKQYNLTLHPEKTRVVYTGRSNDLDKRGHGLSRKFTFLGYDFKPRVWKGRIVFTPGMGKGALKKIRQTIEGKWQLKHRLSQSLHELAIVFDRVIRGWVNYYGHHRRSELHKLARLIDRFLVHFIKRKVKRAKSSPLTWKQAWKYLDDYKKKCPHEFSHWHMICPVERGAV